MATLNSYHLGVSLRPKPILPAIRQATFKVEKKIGYRYFEFGEDVVIQDSEPISKIMESVLNLITPARALHPNELEMFEVSENSGWLALDDLEPKNVENFLNTYGQIGLANYYRRDGMTNLMTPQAFISLTKIPYKYLAVLKEEDSATFRKRIRRIWYGQEIPFSWVEDDLRKLAKCIRMKLALDKNFIDGFEEIKLGNTKQMRRIIHAWDRSGLVIPPYKDSGNFLPLKSSWNLSEKQMRAILDDFSSSVNSFLRPISSAINTERSEDIAQRNSGVETAICYEIFSRIEPMMEKVCANPICKRLFIIDRKTKRFCSDNCSNYLRNKKSRAKKRVSAKSAGSKKKKGRAK